MDIELGILPILSPSPSSWSLATTKVDDSTPDLSPPDEILVPDTEQTPIVRERDHYAITQLLKFRPFNNRFELIPYITPQFGSSETPCPLWAWKHYQCRGLNAEEIAASVARESMSKISQIPFADWVHHARGLAPNSIYDFEQQYDILSCRLYYYLRRHPDEVSKYSEVEMKLKTEDPFIHAAIQNSCQCVSENHYSKLHLDFHVLIQPLRVVLGGPLPIEHISQQLEVLAIRYKQSFFSPEVDWSEFKVDTSFFDNICLKDTRTLAIELCETDLSFFRRLSIDSILAEESDSARTLLNNRWNKLSRDVQECVGVGNTAGKVLKLAKELDCDRNYYSLTAVLTGLKLGNSLVPEELHYLIDSNDNYKAYRQRVRSVPALHFLFPFIRSRHTSSAVNIVNASNLYVQKYCQNSTWRKWDYLTILLSWLC